MARKRKCAAIGCNNEAYELWQPGLDSTALYRPGYHIRGFAAIPLCEEHADIVRQGLQSDFLIEWKGQVWSAANLAT